MLSQDEYKEIILGRLFRGLNAWKKPIVEKSIGPYFPEVFDRYQSEISSRMKLAQDFIDALRETQIEILGRMYLSPRLPNSPKSPIEESSAYKELERAMEMPQAPLWFAGGFGNLKYKANYAYWSKMSQISLAEATCLSLGFEPLLEFESFAPNSDKKRTEVRQAVYKTYGAKQAEEVINFYLKRRELISRSLFQENKAKIEVSEFRDWIGVVKLEVPQELIDLPNRNTADAKLASKTASEIEARFDNREKISLATLVAVMAIDGYGFDPKASRSPTARELSDICALNGIGLSDDTIRKYLKLGVQHLPDDWEQ